MHVGSGASLRRTHRHEVLLHEGGEHVVPDGGHDVAEVQRCDGAALLLGLLSKGLAGMLQLQLLHNTSQGRAVKHRSPEPHSTSFGPMWG